MNLNRKPNICVPCSPRETLKLLREYNRNKPLSDELRQALICELKLLREIAQKPASGITPASALLYQDPRQTLPQVVLYSFPALPDGTAAFGPKDLLDP